MYLKCMFFVLGAESGQCLLANSFLSTFTRPPCMFFVLGAEMFTRPPCMFFVLGAEMFTRPPCMFFVLGAESVQCLLANSFLSTFTRLLRMFFPPFIYFVQISDLSLIFIHICYVLFAQLHCMC